MGRGKSFLHNSLGAMSAEEHVSRCASGPGSTPRRGTLELDNYIYIGCLLLKITDIPKSELG